MSAAVGAADRRGAASGTAGGGIRWLDSVFRLPVARHGRCQRCWLPRADDPVPGPGSMRYSAHYGEARPKARPVRGVQFEMFGPLRTEFLNYVRTVSSTFDGSRWVSALMVRSS